jgi:hypothetical protein
MKVKMFIGVRTAKSGLTSCSIIQRVHVSHVLQHSCEKFMYQGVHVNFVLKIIRKKLFTERACVPRVS